MGKWVEWRRSFEVFPPDGRLPQPLLPLPSFAKALTGRYGATALFVVPPAPFPMLPAALRCVPPYFPVELPRPTQYGAWPGPGWVMAAFLAPQHGFEKRWESLSR